MFKVKHIRTSEVFTVYFISGTMFLIYDYKDGWIYEPMEDFKPVED